MSAGSHFVKTHMTRTFKDNDGREWSIYVSPIRLEQLRTEFALDFTSRGTLFDTLAKVAGDPMILANVLWALCKREAADKGIGWESFGESLGGDSLMEGFDAFTEAMIDFCPDKATRENLRLAIAKVRQFMGLTADAVRTAINGIDPATLH